MSKRVLSFFVVCFLLVIKAEAQGQLCANSEPFCAGGTSLTFPNSNVTTPGASPFSEGGIDYSCATGGGPNDPNSWPFPAWYFLQVDNDGDLSFSISQSQNADGSGAQLDVDFNAWGPFTSNTLTCDMDLTNANKVDCSWLAATTEFLDIPGAVSGEIYVVMITNFSTQPGFITLQQTNAGAPGAGGTDCSIVNSINLCDNESIDLDATTTGAITYQWTRNGVSIAETGPILTNVVAPSAVYDAVALNGAGNVLGTVQFNLNFEAVPIANPIPDQLICDDNNDGFFEVDFSNLDTIVLGTQSSADFTVSYHNSLANAEMGSMPIVGLYANAMPFTLETIFVRIENNTNTDCVSTSSFTINVFNSALANPVADQLICDDNNDGFWEFDFNALRPIVLGTQSATEYTVTFHPTQADADANTAALPDLYTNQMAYTAETITVRIENNLNTNCFETTDFIIDVFDQPIANPVDDQLICDDNNDGFWEFDLTTFQSDVLGTQLATDFEVTFHNSQNDADMDMGALTTPYTNQVAYQQETIFVRIENVDNTDCFETTSFFVDVFNQPTATPFSFELCDNALDGSDTNGFVQFDLPSINAQILGAQDPLLYTVSYHLDQANADANTNPLPNLYTNAVANTDQIVARVENNDNTDCFETAIVDLIVNELPVITDMVELLQCDNDADGLSSFNLTEAEVLISTNAASETFTYYNTLPDANAGVNAIANPTAFPNTDPSSNPDMLFVRVENAETCFRVAQLDLLVSATQIPATVEILYEECDTDAIDGSITNGITTFNFSDAEAQIRALSALPAGQNLTFTYYENEADALTEINAIPDISNHRNDASPFEQEIYVRIDSDVDNACVGLGVHVRLRTINPTPNIDPADLELCDDVTVGDLVEFFDLTQNEAFILNGDPNVVATYHLSFAEANAGTPAIPNPTAYSNTNPTETIFVRVTNPTTSCYAIVDFDITVNPLPEVVVVISDFFECENNTDFLFDFDLESKTDEILGGQDPTLFTVTYHDSQQDADALADALVSPYTNTSNPQQIFVAITNNTTGCSTSILSFNIEVNEGADAVDTTFEACDIVGDNDGSTQFDLTTQNAIVLDGQDPAAFSITYHDSFDNAFNNVQPLPTLYENLVNPQIIFARVSNVIRPDECFEIAEVTLQVNLLPIFDLQDEYILCITSNDEAVVDVPPVLDTELSDTDYSFEWTFNGTVLPTETAPSLIPTQGGTYAVTVTDISTSVVTACTNFDSAEVIESGVPDTFDVSVTSQAFTGNNMIVAVATGNSTYEYSLDNGPWESVGEFEDVTGGDHTVAVRDINGCGVITQNVLVIDYPRFFTPNGDGNNDTWAVEGIFTQPSAVIFIFDRYGKLLKQLSPTSAGWDGTYRGNLMPSSDYWFSLEYIEPTTGEARNFTAHFSLKR